MVSKIISEEIVYLDYPVQHFNNFNYIQWPWIYKPYYREERMNSGFSVKSNNLVGTPKCCAISSHAVISSVGTSFINRQASEMKSFKILNSN